MKILPLAQELNTVLEAEAPAVFAQLSRLGRRLYFPKGIISQSAEAKARAHRFNATIGIATEKRVPMHLPSVGKRFPLEPGEIYPYAPTGGRPVLRKLWREKQLEENPSMRGKVLSDVVVTSALTHGLSLVGDLFLDAGDRLILPAHFWGNYRLTFEVRNEAEIVTYPYYDGERFNGAGFRQALLDAAGAVDKAMVILNFPNNPTGFTPSVEDASLIREALLEAAESGLRLTVVCDDAYFGLFYDDSCLKESIFGYVAGLHENILAVKLDGATKELFAWGFRVGFLTLAAAGSGDLGRVHEALVKKFTGAVRGGISNSPNPTQSLVEHLLQDEDSRAERREKRDLLAARARRTREVLERPEFAEAWTPYPFNSGYFMCVRLHRVDAEELRVHLLDKYGIGVISSGKSDIRVAFSCLEVDEIDDLFVALHAAWQDLAS